MINPAELAAKAQSIEEQNYKFRTFLKIRADDDKLDAQFLSLHKELFADYDCSKCANCCKTLTIIMRSDEAQRIAAYLNMTENEFREQYLIKTDVDEDDEYDDAGERPYKFKESPCPFLEADGHCRIQSCKPNGCKGFPFTDRPRRLSSMLSIIGHAEVCPIVFEILERLKVMYKFRNRR